LKLEYVLTVCDFLLIFGLTVSALYVVILVGYIVKMSLQWDIVTAIFPRPFAAGLLASMAYAVKKHLTRTPLSEVKPMPRVVIPSGISTTLKDKPRRLYEQILACVQTAPQELQGVKPPGVRPSSKRLDDVEYNISELRSRGKSVYEIGLRLSMDPVQVKEAIKKQAEKRSLFSILKRVKSKIKREGMLQ